MPSADLSRGGVLVMNKSTRFSLVTTAIAIGTLYAGIWRAEADSLFAQTNLVSDIPGLAALTDPNLQNPWGISHSPTSPIWVSDQRTNITTLYAVTNNGVTKAAPLGTDGNIVIPTTATGPQGPTGQVFNSGTDFKLANNNPATFIFANLNGTISAWNGGQQASIQATTPGAVYTVLAISTNSTQSRLYAAITAQGRIDVFDANFAPVNIPGAFATPAAAAGLVPFNVQTIGGNIYVTYAPPGVAAQRS